MTAWAEPEDTGGFGIAALPYGVLEAPGGPRVVVRIGERALDVAAVADDLAPALRDLFDAPTLDPLLAAGPDRWRLAREQVTEWLSTAAHRPAVEPHLLALDGATMRLPFTVADYVDFYSSRDHAENVGRIFRPGGTPLPANWLHLPIGYHGRAGTVVVSGTGVVRPTGQRKPPDGDPVAGPSTRLDLEAEVGFVVGVGSALGSPVPIERFADHVFGALLVNDWSARDLQVWESVPLGPFLGKSFATSISAWVLPLAALDGARIEPPPADVPLLGYLSGGEPWGLDLRLEIAINGAVVSRPSFRRMSWTPAQQLAHLTVNGASLRTGDLFASGTVSGPHREERGCLLELTWNGTEPLTLPDGSTRTFLDDGDEVVITATAPTASGGMVALGPVAGRVLPAVPPLG